ncbi:hypothetical protein CHS0354_031205 [Potamilus streckersoni]|uniref:SUEL-type lectin domain-containing protein n=1 Tax=Potamilus streckersoni TaxID=2493646 RepID=A0AAE0TKS4_9BIVA|nr:hypothetical protein CHS0354_031205 [Potamilus streckersoni]
MLHNKSPRTAQKLVCEQKLDSISCPLGELITIVSVQYGRTQPNLCNPYGISISNLNCRSTLISTNAVLSSCQGRTICLLSADNRILGEDPCPAIPKYLELKTSSKA